MGKDVELILELQAPTAEPKQLADELNIFTTLLFNHLSGLGISFYIGIWQELKVYTDPYTKKSWFTGADGVVIQIPLIFENTQLSERELVNNLRYVYNHTELADITSLRTLRPHRRSN